MAVGPTLVLHRRGAFRSANTHYIRDTATFNAAIGVALAGRGEPAFLACACAGVNDVQFACTASTTWSTSTAPTRRGMVTSTSSR